MRQPAIHMIRHGAAVLLLFLMAWSSASAQAPVTVRGQVIDRLDRRPIVGVTIQLTGLPPTLTDSDGRFRFERVVPGRYSLDLIGLGYAPDERTLLVRSDTAVIIELDRAPIALDTLAVAGRRIMVRGKVRDGPTGTGLIDVDVHAPPNRHARTDPLGRFRLGGVPALAATAIRVQEFGYLPATVTVSASRDTTLEIALEPDSVALAMIAEQKHRIAERAAHYRYGFDSVIDRPQLLRNLNGSAMDLIRRILGSRAGRIQCVVIDEEPMIGARAASAPATLRGRQTIAVRATGGALADILPDRLEYIDILKFGRQNEGLMVRAYTRAFVQRMTGGAEQLVPLDRIIEGAHIGLCR